MKIGLIAMSGIRACDQELLPTSGTGRSAGSPRRTSPWPAIVALPLVVGHPAQPPGYVQFPAALLVVFALLFLRIAWCPVSGRNLIPLGMLLKVACCGIVFGYRFTTGVPSMWKPWAVADIIFLVLSAWVWRELGPARPSEG